MGLKGFFKKVGKRVLISSVGVGAILGRGYAAKKGVPAEAVDFALMSLFGGVIGTKIYDEKRKQR